MAKESKEENLEPMNSTIIISKKVSVEIEDGENEGAVQLDRNFTLLLCIWNEGLRKMNVVDAVARLSPSAHEAWARFPVPTSCGLISLVLFSSQRGFFPGYSGFPVASKTNRV